VNRACRTHERSDYKFLIGKLKKRRSLGRPRHRLKNNVTMDFKWGMDWVHLAQGENK
jgi:hypothetical protein